MKETMFAPETLAAQEFFLSQVTGKKVTLGGKKVGRLQDLVIKENHTLPFITHLVVSLPFGQTALVPWEAVGTINPKEITLAVDDIAPYIGVPDESAVLLKDHILDKKALDLEGRELEVVYDVKLALRNGRLYVTDVDLSRYGLLRRIGMARLANFVYSLADSIRDQTISWKYIQPLPEDMGRFHGDIRLNVLKEKLADMHPVDLADILEEMDHENRMTIFDELPAEQASDTLEEIEPAIQRDMVESMHVERAAHLIDEMTPGQAADILAAISTPEAKEILDLLSPENASKIRQILDKQEENILDFATQEYVAFPPDYTVEKAQDEYRTAARGKDVVMYIYVVDGNGRLLGILDIKELLQAEDAALLKDVMVDNLITLDADSSLKEAAQMFNRYDFRAIPITDDDDKLLGVVTYRDVMGLKHSFIE